MKRRIFALLLALCLMLSAVPAFAAYTPEEQYQILLETDDLIRQVGLESWPDDDPLGRALIQLLEEDPQLFNELMSRMLSGYDSHSMFLPAGSYSQAFAPDTAYVGIGVTLRADPQGAMVTDVNLQGPAAKAGVRMGDVIVRAAGQPLKGLSLDDITSLLRGKEGTTVEISVLRGGETLTFRLTRAALSQLNYSGAHLEDGIYYMKWSRISDDGSYELFQKGLAELQAKGDRCLILDLRDNPGGALDLAFSMVSDLIPKACAFFRIAYRGSDPEVLTQRFISASGEGIEVPHIYILVNENTASAAEVITAGLCDTGYAVSVGTTTYGKGRAQQHHILEDDSAIVLTTMKLLSLRQGDYEGVGLTPNVRVSNTLVRGEDAITVPEDVALAPYSCSDNGVALNQALVALGLLDQLPESPWQVGEETLSALTRLKAAYQLEDTPGADGATLRLINQLLSIQGQGRYLQDDQLNTALELARDALKKDAKAAKAS